MSASIMAAIARFECWMGTQAAQNWLLLGSLIFVGLYVVLTRKLVRWQRKQWALDSRKEEWGELIGTLTKCFPK
jgi:drug/metabolite transporter (DMT)-like permease